MRYRTQMHVPMLTLGRELDRFVVWDYIARRKQIIS